MRFLLNRLVFASILALLFLGGTSAFGQGTSASLTGQVTDNSGAVVPGATVTVTNTDTSLAQTVTANGGGIYLIAPLPPGHYKLTVESHGFERYLQTGIELSVSVNSTQNVVLKTGSVQETVTVFENAELINTSTPELGTTINEAAVTQLPLNGRDPSSLVFLAPGTTSVLAGGGQPGIQAGFSFPTETGASANGGRQGSTEYYLDGVPNMDNYLGLTAPFPNADATQEFRVITNNFNASYGFAPGAVVSVETRSGSNSFHGGAFEFLRNKDLNASNYFSHSVDPLRRNQFGGYVGGPIKRDKIFFFLNYQGTRGYSAATTNFTQTPTAAMLAGDFSAVGTTLCNPTSKNTPVGCPFATVGGKPNQVNPALFNQAAVTVTTTGLPLGGDAQNTPGGVFYPGAAVIQNFDEGTARLDFNISPSQRISVRSFVDNLIQPSEDIPGNILSVLNPSPWSEVFGERMEFYNEAVSHTWTISPTMVNTVSVFWTQMSAHNAAAVKDINGQNMCWSRYINVNELPGQCYMEGFSVSGGEGFNGGWTEPSQEVRTTYGVYDNLSKTIGRHVLSFGMNLQHQYAAENTQYPTTPIIGFNGQYTGNGLADWLLGYMQSYEQGAGEIAVVRGWQPGFYGQDQFRIRPDLTITAGLRWDPNIAPAVAGGRGAAFVPGQQSTLFPNSPLGLVFPGDKGISDGLMPNSYKAYWEPRVGVAWQPSFLPNTSIRAAFGMFTAPLQYSMYNHTADISPFSPTYTLQGGLNTPLSLSDPWSQNTGTGFVSPFPPFAPFKPPSNAIFSTPFTIPAVFDQDFKLGVTQSWNLSIERQFGANLIVRGA
ncbi:MAG TPA: TonB-dependent receptor, partial [Candidatus Acidoferrum sp.]|nr:TonB-dependent receptor [Candidatus Acidoferrum sp.]